MNTEELNSAMGFAQACWPHSVAAGSEAVWLAWSKALSAHEHHDVCTAIERLATAGPMPELHVLLAEVREVEDERRQKITAPEPSPHAPPWSLPPVQRDSALRDMEAQAARSRREQKAEVRELAKQVGYGADWIEARCVEIDRVGPVEERMHRLMAGTCKPGEWPADLFPSGGPAPIGSGRARPQEPQPTLESEARRIADAYQADKASVDPKALEPELRAAVREELIRRKQGVTA